MISKMYNNQSNCIAQPRKHTKFWRALCIEMIRANKDAIISNSMKLSPSWDDDSCSADKNISRFLLNQNVHYGVHKGIHFSLSSVRHIQSSSSYQY
jgi:hypothetical protein